jgi:type I site-specific restriction endonuclease
MNEAETLAEHIDPAIAVAGLGVVEGSQIRREYSITQRRLEGFGLRGKSMTADYVLVYRNTKLGVVEAKAWDEPLTLSAAQAKKYAEKLTQRPMTGCKKIRWWFYPTLIVVVLRLTSIPRIVSRYLPWVHVDRLR